MTLTDQERDVARLVAEGWGDKQIGARLGVSRSRVTHIISNIAAAWSLDRSKSLRVQIARRVAQEAPKTA